MNRAKSSILFSRNVENDRRRSAEPASKYLRTDLGSYFGVPLHRGKKIYQSYNYVVEKMQQKLSGWKAKCLSLAGKNSEYLSPVIGCPDPMASCPRGAHLFISLLRAYAQDVLRSWATLLARSKLR